MLSDPPRHDDVTILCVIFIKLSLRQEEIALMSGTLLALRFWGLKRPDPTSGARKPMHVASLHAGPIPGTGMAR
jgi:hypothetical protein